MHVGVCESDMLPLGLLCYVRSARMSLSVGVPSLCAQLPDCMGSVRLRMELHLRTRTHSASLPVPPSDCGFALGQRGRKRTHRYSVRIPPGPRRRSGTRLKLPRGHLCSEERETEEPSVKAKNVTAHPLLTLIH